MAFDLEAEVRDLAARRDIQKALMRYMRGQDRLDRELHLSAFHEDAYVDCGMMAGTASEFVDFAQNFLADLGGSQHLIGQIDLDVSGDTATGEVYFCAWHRLTIDGVDNDLFVAGRYVDDYACRNGEWRILRRREIIDWARTDPATDHFLAAHPEVPRGDRHGQDFSQMRNWPV